MAAASTDPERFTKLYDFHYPRVYAYVVSRAGRQLADEVVSETFLVAWRRRRDLPAGAELPWLLGVARNVLREQYRAEARRRLLDTELRAWIDEARSSGGEVAGDVADDVADRITMLSALAELSDEDREVLTLVAWHGLGRRAAAKVIGCSVATFSVRLHRARRRLERAMSGTAEAAARPMTLMITPRRESSR